MSEIQKKVLEGGDILKIKDNRTFHALFNNQDKKATLWFMSQILQKRMDEIKEIIKIENNELKPLNHYDKGKTVDFIVSVGDDVVIVEMNNNNSGRDYTRNLFYTFHALLNKVEVGNKYTKKHGILINLNWFTNDNEKLKNMPGVTEIKYPYPIIGKEHEDSIIIVKNVNLSFYDKMMYNGVKMKDFLWKLFTINKLEEIQDVGKNIKELSHYCKEIERLSMSKEYCMTIWNETLEDKLSGITFYEDGKKDKEREMIINFFNNGVSLDVIAKSVNLSLSEVQNIINSNKK